MSSFGIKIRGVSSSWRPRKSPHHGKAAALTLKNAELQLNRVMTSMKKATKEKTKERLIKTW